MTFDASSHRRLATESDNWPLTWSDDDNQYAVWGDGGGFGSDGTEGRVEFGVARVSGDHDDYEGFNRFARSARQPLPARIVRGGVVWADVTEPPGEFLRRRGTPVEEDVVIPALLRFGRHGD